MKNALDAQALELEQLIWTKTEHVNKLRDPRHIESNNSDWQGDLEAHFEEAQALEVEIAGLEQKLSEIYTKLPTPVV